MLCFNSIAQKENQVLSGAGATREEHRPVGRESGLALIFPTIQESPAPNQWDPCPQSPCTPRELQGSAGKPSTPKVKGLSTKSMAVLSSPLACQELGREAAKPFQSQFSHHLERKLSRPFRGWNTKPLLENNLTLLKCLSNSLML